ncbi:hypothetical protein GUITHDRAFT_119430 [Guillardia theta CCMP2712]|uniref:Uncharacterized protein n=1 Tax=Guillardia theta (strain CCMP2712) TaxID=905079 RepID=L1IET7_GUITC|nr:hypothetical protein GUITHDRAFT_119430 [Guillardia theta CCMP2712]EKX34424.1 hypothetical protein GUITHDRAFT_119430 [Guillardia theta CCMP2712]|eukprot:XP_005821404.1 hypothetical protein GUITHDRAFT_119430 [Guillardia theta CCMP2712]
MSGVVSGAEIASVAEGEETTGLLEEEEIIGGLEEEDITGVEDEEEMIGVLEENAISEVLEEKDITVVWKGAGVVSAGVLVRGDEKISFVVSTGLLQVQYGSTRHSELQPSPEIVFPSSQVSPGSRTPFPHN